MAREESRAIFFMKVKATSSALKLIEELKAQHGEELLFHQFLPCSQLHTFDQSFSDPQFLPDYLFVFFLQEI